MRGRSRRKKRTGKMVSLQKRFLAFVLTLAMIFTSVGTDLNVSYAAICHDLHQCGNRSACQLCSIRKQSGLYHWRC